MDGLFILVTVSKKINLVLKNNLPMIHAGNATLAPVETTMLGRSFKKCRKFQKIN